VNRPRLLLFALCLLATGSWLPSKLQLYGRQTWSAAEAVGSYWTAGFGYGQNW